MLGELNKRLELIGFEWICAGLMFFSGILLVFLTPPYQVPDEPAHFARAYQISEGEFRSPIRMFDGTPALSVEVPKAFVPSEFVSNLTERKIYSAEKIWKDFFVTVNDDERELFANPTMGQYSPMAYLPQSIAAFLARILGWSAGSTFYLMRLSALLFSIACVFFSIRFLPQKSGLLFLIAVMPMFLVETCSVSADAVIDSMALLCTSYLLSLRDGNSIFSRREMILLILWAVIFGLLKQVYGVILLLYFLISASRMGRKRLFYFFGIVILSIYFLVSTAWLHFASQGYMLAPLLGVGADVGGQLEFLRQQPFQFAQILLSTWASHGAEYGMGMIGILGWYSVRLPSWFYFLYGALLLWAVFSGKGLRLHLCHRAWMLAGAILSVAAICLFCYMTWTAVGHPYIEGVQGRYLIPLFPMVAIALSKGYTCYYEHIVACAAGVLSVGITLWKTVEYFY